MGGPGEDTVQRNFVVHTWASFPSWSNQAVYEPPGSDSRILGAVSKYLVQCFTLKCPEEQGATVLKCSPAMRNRKSCDYDLSMELGWAIVRRFQC